MPLPHERNLGPFKISESYWRLMQTDPFDDKTLLDGTGSLVSYLAVSGTIDAFEFIGDGNRITNLNLDSYGLISSSNQVVELLQGAVVNVETIIAQQYIVSSSVTYITQSYSSGSTAFGDSVDDTHIFTGSLSVFGSITGSISTSSIENFETEVSRSIAMFGFGSQIPNGVVSGSQQTLEHLFGTNIVSSSGQLDILGLSPLDTVEFTGAKVGSLVVDGNVFVDGTLTAKTYVISSSVTNIESISVSGSTNFGDTDDDTHAFTGSMFVTGPITANSFSGIFNGVISSSQQISNLGFITSSGEASAVEWGNILNIPNNIVSGSGQRDVLGLSETDDVTFANIFGTNASFDGNVLVTGTITARTFVISSSVINQNVLNVSGSSFFGNSFDDTHTFTGSVLISGSFYVPSAISLDPSSEYGSLAINGGDLFIYM